MRPYIFLDCDGVLNGYLDAGSDEEQRKVWIEQRVPIGKTQLAHFRALCEHVNPIVVISSTWRKLYSREQFIEHFGEWFDKYLAHSYRTGNDKRGRRGYEISEYLKEWGMRAYIVIDDEDDDLLPWQPLVKTPGRVGLTYLNICRAVELLRMQRVPVEALDYTKDKRFSER